ncbi:MAG: hypothetical protein ACE5F7_01780 [Nitrospiria bacterium]
MFQNPEQFIQEKLEKKFLSINTIRDGVLAAFLIGLQKQVEQKGQASPWEAWRKNKANALRRAASDAFASIEAPFEYPTRAQLASVIDILKKTYEWDQWSTQEKEAFETTRASFFDKFEDDD